MTPGLGRWLVLISSSESVRLPPTLRFHTLHLTSLHGARAGATLQSVSSAFTLKAKLQSLIWQQSLGGTVGFSSALSLAFLLCSLLSLFLFFICYKQKNSVVQFAGGTSSLEIAALIIPDCLLCWEYVKFWKEEGLGEMEHQ